MKTQRTGAVREKRRLAVLLDLWAGAAFLAVIAGCVLIEYTRNPNISALDRLSHHIIELLLYGVILLGVLWLVLRAAVIRPIDEIFGQLYRIGGGDRAPVTVQTSIREIQNVVEAINIMLWRMEQQADVKALDHVRRKAVAIRQYVAGAADIPPAEVTALLDQLADLEARLRDVGLPARIRAARRREDAPECSGMLLTTKPLYDVITAQSFQSEGRHATRTEADTRSGPV